MIPEIKTITKISPDQSVVCVVGGDSIPDSIQLSKSEIEYVSSKLADKADTVLVNSYFKFTYIIRVDKNKPLYQVHEAIRKAASTIKGEIKSNKHQELVITSDGTIAGAALAFAEGYILGIYSFERYLTKSGKEGKKNSLPSRLIIAEKADKEEITWLQELCSAVYKTRDLINEPPNHLNAPVLAKEIKKMGNEAGFSVEILTKGKIEALKMGGLLAVNRGSVDPPVFCILEWKPSKAVNKKPVVLVGKGIIYDTGGLNIKTGEYMAQMKGDMAGAATVSGVMYTLAKTKVPMHVIALVPATDNRPGGNAYTQGDILTMHNGTTVEVGNTDAEGRLILADAISYAGRFNPELIINIATLTGSAAMAFGNLAIATMGNAGEDYFATLGECGERVYERIARMPFWEEYGELIKSDIADLKNVGGREAGAITAGKFLETFTPYPFIHLDIAGTGLLKKDDFYRIKEGPGSGLRLLATFIRELSHTKKKTKK
ncbi:MAG: leucyl aminopeptidase family protein [Bacteroidales bacterium]